MLINIISLSLGVSLLFYCLLAGADFGAGMLELFIGKFKRAEQVSIISHAIGPVWEANHVWIILAIVIFFNGFPSAFSQVCILFHIPILLLLVGIILRGTAFTFASYDALKGESQKYYRGVFIFSSFAAPLMIGFIVGGLFLGRAPSEILGFYPTFIEPWLNMFCFSMGLFVCALFSFLAAVYLVGETKDLVIRDLFSRKARMANALCVICGVAVFFSAEFCHFPLLQVFIRNKVTLTIMATATLILVPLWMGLNNQRVWISRVLGAAQMSLVLLGWATLQFPIILVRGKNSLTIYNSAAPESTLRFLLYALIFGAMLIFPALFFLFKVFKVKK